MPGSAQYRDWQRKYGTVAVAPARGGGTLTWQATF
jgi:hypothetical protein